jgi:CBS domain containing-hemolysin-like protein
MTSEKKDREFQSKRVADIMIPLDDYPHLPVWSTLREAIELIHKAQLTVRGRKSLPRSILLFDLDGSIAGMVRRRDIMRGLEPNFLISRPLDYRMKLFDVSIDPNLSELPHDKVVKGIREQADRPVADVMRPIKCTVNHDEHIIKAAYEMVNNRVTLIPVLQEGKVVGVVRTVDVFRDLAEIVLSTP